MIVLDTHAWIWLVAEPDRLSARARAACGRAEELGVPAICLWEVAMLVQKGRLGLDRDVSVWIDQALRHPRLSLQPLTPAIAVASTRLPAAFLGDPADRLIAASALVHGAALVTMDLRLRRYRGLRTVW